MYSARELPWWEHPNLGWVVNEADFDVCPETDRIGAHFDLSSLRTMPVGGAAAPRAMIEGYQKKIGVPITHAWSVTEMTPLGTVSRLKSHMHAWPEDRQFEVRAKQGIPVPGVEIRVVDEDGKEIPWDGKTMGELQYAAHGLSAPTTTTRAQPTRLSMAGSAPAMW